MDERSFLLAAGCIRTLRADVQVVATILIIDDEEVIAVIVRHHLDPLGHRVVSALDGASGLASAREVLPDVIVLDLVMPRMDGHQVLDELKADASTRDIPVIVLTLLRSAERDARCLAQGASKVLEKPFDPTELAAELHLMVAE